MPRRQAEREALEQARRAVALHAEEARVLRQQLEEERAARGAEVWEAHKLTADEL